MGRPSSTIEIPNHRRNNHHSPLYNDSYINPRRPYRRSPSSDDSRDNHRRHRSRSPSYARYSPDSRRRRSPIRRRSRSRSPVHRQLPPPPPPPRRDRGNYGRGVPEEDSDPELRGLSFEEYRRIKRQKIRKSLRENIWNVTPSPPRNDSIDDFDAVADDDLIEDDSRVRVKNSVLNSGSDSDSRKKSRNSRVRVSETGKKSDTDSGSGSDTDTGSRKRSSKSRRKKSSDSRVRVSVSAEKSGSESGSETDSGSRKRISKKRSKKSSDSRVRVSDTGSDSEDSDDGRKKRSSRKKSSSSRRRKSRKSNDSDDDESESEEDRKRRKSRSRRGSSGRRKKRSGSSRRKSRKRSNDEDESGSESRSESGSDRRRKKMSKKAVTESSEGESDGEKTVLEVDETGLKTVEESNPELEELKDVVFESQKMVTLLDNEPIVGPQPLPKAEGHISYGGALRPGEGDAIAQYVQQGKRIPRRGEVGLSADEISKFEDLGYVMSGSRHQRMNAIRIRKENQVYSAEDKRALAMYNFEEKAKREGKVMTDLKRLVQRTIGEDVVPNHDPFGAKDEEGDE